MRSIRLSLLTYLLLLCRVTFADYAWLPKYNHLIVKLGGDYFSTSENFASDGSRNAILFQNQAVDLREYRLILEPEYSFANNWSTFLKAGFASGNVENATTASGALLSGSMLTDFNLGVRWTLLDSVPLLTLETQVKIPPYTASNIATDTVLLGDGNFDWATTLHAGYRFNRYFIADLSPGIVARFSGYDTAFVLGAMAGVMVSPVYFRLIADWSTSLSKPSFTAPLTQNGEVGSGGSFAHLSKYADLFALSGRLGVFVTKNWRVETCVSQSLAGKMAPNFVRVGINVIADLDLYQPPPKKIQVKEIPFDSNPDYTTPKKSKSQGADADPSADSSDEE